MTRPRIAVHKFASCDGCQLAFLNAGEALLALAQRADIVHFAEAGWHAPLEPVDIAFVEGSISTPEDLERIRAVRESARILVAIGACATAGGLQALRNGLGRTAQWIAEIYAQPEHIQSLDDSRAVSDCVRVDLELWGCPVTTEQVVSALADLIKGLMPAAPGEAVCLECKRRGLACVMVAQAQPCLGPVTRAGCGALCPSLGRGCYGCFGPAAVANTAALARQFEAMGLTPEEIARRFLFITPAAPAFAQAGKIFRDKTNE